MCCGSCCNLLSTVFAGDARDEQAHELAEYANLLFVLCGSYCCCCCWPPLQAMRVMNKRMNLPNMQKILMEFEKQNERMEMTSDMMGDAIDDAMEVRGVLAAQQHAVHS
jgi:hypothetical protein